MFFLYRLLFPVVFLFFLPGLIVKLVRRGGWKKTYMERFGIFRRPDLKGWEGAIWVHAVSVGETNVALSLLNAWNKVNPDHRYVLSTTTTTGQEIARNKAPENVKVIFCPRDSFFAVRAALNLLRPSALVIMETELWPELIFSAKKRGIRLFLVNTRISDKSFGGYYRFRFFFAPVLNAFDNICAQTALDQERILALTNGKAKATVAGNIKFDQPPPEKPGFPFADVFGADRFVILSCSTHSPEEALHLKAFLTIRKEFPAAALCIVPRHAERGAELEKQITAAGLTCFRRSTGTGCAEHPDVLLADTTGELPGFIKGADLILMGKTMAGNDDGQNIIEPAVMGKGIICGPKLRNFRQALDLLVRADGVCRLKNGNDEQELTDAIRSMLSDPAVCAALGERAKNIMAENRGALERIIHTLENNIETN